MTKLEKVTTAYEKTSKSMAHKYYLQFVEINIVDTFMQGKRRFHKVAVIESVGPDDENGNAMAGKMNAFIR